MIFNISVWKPFFIWIQRLIKKLAKSASLTLISGLFPDLTRSRSDLVIENALLRHQLIVLNRY
jgi:hypothetical protein